MMMMMKSLSSSCSKAILHKSLSSFPCVTSKVHVSDRTDFCFNLTSKNDSNYCFLKLVQNNGIVVRAVPSKTQVDFETIESELETVDSQDQQTEESEQTSESKFVRVTFQLEKNCDFGEQFLVVGDDPVLGSWDPANGLSMTWSDGHIWTVELDMPTGKSILYKFILKGKAGDIVWQPGSDRTIQTWATTKRIIVCEDWENDELSKIIEEDQVDKTNEESQVDREMSSFTEHLDNPEEGLVSDVSKISGIEDSQTHSEEKPPGEPDLLQINDYSISSPSEKPVAIVAENIGSSEDLINCSEESADSPGNDNTIHVGHNGIDVPIKNQERTSVESNLFDFEGSPVLVVVPDLTTPVVANEEAGSGEVQESTTVYTPIEAFESKDQNIPEFTKEQEFNDGTPPVINSTLKEPELLHNEYEEQSHLAPEMEDRSISEPVDGNVVQNDIEWGRQTVLKFLTKLGLF
ncbi:hypothetical protein Lal_00015861 [Lupinus albus]|uniref:Putative glucan 1,4-alpha-glucosidase n=1 Tax=Lupinus albus TaxID=3870 RepID=A0A6A5MWE7_LUPAL|nr:putative glucan 1,4-alpha-glucosidase [Lupinus albus]KAF1877199.1 hypothetical protein Lal_00015861 [Lupinus albus]